MLQLLQLKPIKELLQKPAERWSVPRFQKTFKVKYAEERTSRKQRQLAIYSMFVKYIRQVIGKATPKSLDFKDYYKKIYIQNYIMCSSHSLVRYTSHICVLRPSHT